MIRTRALRTALSAAVVLLAMGGLSALPAQAVTGPVAAPALSQAEEEAATPATRQVTTFLDEYRRAVLGQSDETPRAVRVRFLSPHLNFRLDGWAEEHDADPVFRAQNVPVRWSAQQVKTENGYASVRLTEFWAGSGSQEVWYTVRLGDLRIVELNDHPAF
ncbi:MULTISPECIES: hypothetical protein [unclassified Streptomyces]|uniref:hypothetical protein n=1 Tax=unclassified Streptomyces TaxID=2593676 RepID=UPI003805EB0A